MVRLSTRGAAKRLGIGNETLANYLRNGKVPAPESLQHGDRTVHGWSEEDIETVRKLLPKIKNGRKTRYQKQKPGVRSQKSVKAKTKKKPQPRAAVPHKKKQ